MFFLFAYSSKLCVREKGSLLVFICFGLVLNLSIQSVSADEKDIKSPSSLKVEQVASPLPKVIKRPEMQAPKYSVDTTCRKIARKLGSVKLDDCKGKDFRATGGVSVEGSPIIYKEYPPVGQREPIGRVLMIGGIHGDEYSSISIMFNWMRTLNKHHSGLFHWRIVPLMNPDGLLRKKPQRMNANGVDLNRNFPTPNWKAESEKYWVQRTQRNPRRYPGQLPLSEPESQWLAHEIETFKPDVIVAVHAPYGILDFDGPRQEAPKRLGHLHLNVLGTYPGSLGNYAGIQKEIPVVTIELPYAGIMPTAAQISSIWTDLVGWLRNNMNRKNSASNVLQVKNVAHTDPS